MLEEKAKPVSGMLRLQRYSYRFAEQVLNSKLSIKQEIEEVLTAEIPDLAALSRPAFNKLLDERFTAKGCRSVFASRLTQAGVSPVFVAQIMGHSGPGVLQIYARAIDEYRRSAIQKLEKLRESQQLPENDSNERMHDARIQ